MGLVAPVDLGARRAHVALVGSLRPFPTAHHIYRRRKGVPSHIPVSENCPPPNLLHP
jgi:hypothetical protein